MMPLDRFTLTGKSILVTGASSGIGRAAAQAMAALGGRVMLAARDEAALASVVDAITAAGGTAAFVRCDVADQADVLAAIDAAEAAHGVLDGLFANAGIGGRFAPIGDFTDDDLSQVMTVNFTSIFWAVRRVLPGMMARGRGSILATGSLASERGMPLTCGYNASKHALLGLMRSAAIEGAAQGVRANCLIPGMIETRMMEDVAGGMADGDVRAGIDAIGRIAPMGRCGTAAEVGDVAAFLMSDAAAYITGQSWAVDGGILGTLSPAG